MLNMPQKYIGRLNFMSDIKIKEHIVEVIKACETAFVSTINLDNFPETRALDNVLNRKLDNVLNRRIDDRLEIYFLGDSDSPKVEQFKKNSNASLYYYVAGSWKNMILFGKLELVTDKSLKDKLWLDDFLQYYKNGKDDERYGIFKFTPTIYKYYPYEAGNLTCSPEIGSI
ncbi:MAG: pyridoxamine 5'-phosphate oxidase family protein [Holosporaceae bacterium]|jgi:general stress protein 26|nr:pyridoxamine 5'-phosphate oxidase family protein [Holosporaceae bacterium]